LARVTSTLGRATYVGARRRSLRLVNPNTAARSAFESEDASRASRSDPASILWQASLRSCDCQESFQARSAHKCHVQRGKQGLRRSRCRHERPESFQFCSIARRRLPDGCPGRVVSQPVAIIHRLGSNASASRGVNRNGTFHAPVSIPKDFLAG